MSAEITFADVRLLVGENFSGIHEPALELALAALFHGAAELFVLTEAIEEPSVSSVISDIATRLHGACNLAQKLAQAEKEAAK